MSQSSSAIPRFSPAEAESLVLTHYGKKGKAKKLNSYVDQNFLFTSESKEKYIIKIANADEPVNDLDMQNKALIIIRNTPSNVSYPLVYPALNGSMIVEIETVEDLVFRLRLLSYLDGVFLADIKTQGPELLESLGSALAETARSLQEFFHPAVLRELDWNLKNFIKISGLLNHLTDPSRRRLVDYFLMQLETIVMPRLPYLRQGVIHSDGNDHNVLVLPDADGVDRVSGLIDFGDMVYSYIIAELAIGLTYAMFDKEKPLETARHVIRGFHEVFPLEEAELELLYYFVAARLCMSVTFSAARKKIDSGNEYLSVSEKQAWDLLEKWLHINPANAEAEFRAACDFRAPAKSKYPIPELLGLREKRLGKSLSVSYQKPLKIVRGALQYLYDENSRPYLDAVNNVPHVGHSHPRVVRAAQRQSAALNTNTRYLHDFIVEYAERLAATLPDPLSVCFFTCSGSEANELALRMARTFTGNNDIVVLDGAYHGNTAAVIDISPYKFDGPGGTGAKAHIHKALMPDPFRGRFKGYGPETGKKYAGDIQRIIYKMSGDGKNPAAIICESILGCGGQIVLPEEYLQESFKMIREAGGICIADEVQVGFGRAGSSFWAFESQQVVPDIVTLGKPMGNGHPLAAVVTTPEIADAFNNGMEYFNTFGGNPVSCAIGLEVLSVIEDENLQENARIVGGYLKEGLEGLKQKHRLIGDVRGLGLFIGIELVRDRSTLEATDSEAAEIAERMKDAGILISTDGPMHNVLKIKPPLIFNRDNADQLINELDNILTTGLK